MTNPTPGYDLDRRVCEILGIEKVETQHIDWAHKPLYVSLDFPRVSTDPATVPMVMAAIAKRLEQLNHRDHWPVLYPLDGKFTAEVFYYRTGFDDRFGRHECDTAPLALCMLAMTMEGK